MIITVQFRDESLSDHFRLAEERGIVRGKNQF